MSRVGKVPIEELRFEELVAYAEDQLGKESDVDLTWLLLELIRRLRTMILWE